MKDCKELAQAIYTRKSVRSFSKAKADVLENDPDLIEVFGLEPLTGSVKIAIKVLGGSQVKNSRSDYCIAFYTEEAPLCLENIGFIGQQLDLALQSRGLGTCWWGMKKPKKDFKSDGGLGCVITMTAGFPQKPETRVYPGGFKRKAAGSITIGQRDSDNLIEAARVAPSAVNLQPWLIEKATGKYSFYMRPPKGIIEKMIKDLRRIDMGIALSHLFIQAKADGLSPSLSFEGKDIAQGSFVASISI